MNLVGCYDIDKNIQLIGIPRTDIHDVKEYGTSIHYKIKDNKYSIVTDYDTFVEYRSRYMGHGITHVYRYYEAPVIDMETKREIGQIKLYKFYVATKSVAAEAMMFDNMMSTHGIVENAKPLITTAGC